MKHDITTLADIQVLVDTFYGQVQKDPLIGGIFISVIKDWPAHLSKMYRFWQTVLLEEHTYHGSPFPPHAEMPLMAVHFDRWLEIWRTTVNSLFEGGKAKEAIWRGEKMAAMFLSKIEYYRTTHKKPLI
ncbi:group III truncated hemoglobin [Gynurincola endophyticus]|jgi:hemoglobin|uniref:group III truncated hemoglobin n=1 Tax=Gynurincola endophyticus TaxID=2479004 RepID=UPI000F8C57CA|nr:group III truncated hemoglobin [Gynurincola endophyticus]